MRHMKQQHPNSKSKTQTNEPNVEGEKERSMVNTIKEILTYLGMESHLSKFEEEDITTELVLKMNEDDLQELCKECGITSYGKRFRFLDEIQKN